MVVYLIGKYVVSTGLVLEHQNTKYLLVLSLEVDMVAICTRQFYNKMSLCLDLQTLTSIPYHNIPSWIIYFTPTAASVSVPISAELLWVPEGLWLADRFGQLDAGGFNDKPM